MGFSRFRVGYSGILEGPTRFQLDSGGSELDSVAFGRIRVGFSRILEDPSRIQRDLAGSE